MLSTEQIIGQGILGWWRSERITGRYGSISLYKEYESIPIGKDLVGQRGSLSLRIVEVLKNRITDDGEDATPKVGDVLVLGKGTAFSDQEDDEYAFGVQPDDGRDEGWLNVDSLYTAWRQTVEVIWQPE